MGALLFIGIITTALLGATGGSVWYQTAYPHRCRYRLARRQYRRNYRRVCRAVDGVITDAYDHMDDLGQNRYERQWI